MAALFVSASTLVKYPKDIHTRSFTTPLRVPSHLRCRALPSYKPTWTPPLLANAFPRNLPEKDAVENLDPPPTTNSPPRQLNGLVARLLLSMVPLCWASFGTCAKLLNRLPVAVSPAIFNVLRMFVAMAMFIPVYFSQMKGKTRSIWPGIQLGLLVSGSNITQLVGLQYGPASRAAFVKQMSTILVPLTAAILRIEPLTRRVALGTLSAFAGIFMLTSPSSLFFIARQTPTVTLAKQIESKDSQTSTLWLADTIQFASAAFETGFVIRMSQLAQVVPSTSLVPMASVKVATHTACTILWLGTTTAWRHLSVSSSETVTPAAPSSRTWTAAAIISNLALIVWGGTMVSGISSVFQAKGQSVVSAGEAACIFATQPLWASLLAYVFLQERMPLTGLVGAVFIMAGAITVSTGKNKSDAKS